MTPNCVVCGCPADVYCHNDNANLCFACDHTVHSAHPLARNHKRTPIGEAVPQTDSIDEHVAVPQDILPMDKQDKLEDIDLSFSDDAWFTVPDTACSTARGGIRTVKAKSFEIDDLFGFDAALDEEVAFVLDPEANDLLTDCLVPNDEPQPVSEMAHPAIASFKSEIDDCELESRPAHVPAEPVPTGAVTAAAPMAQQTASIAYTMPAANENILNVDNYIPFSLIPVDPSTRNAALSERREKVQRFKEKKKNRQFKKLIRYASRKRYAEVRPRIKGRFARKDEIAAAKAAGVPLECM